MSRLLVCIVGGQRAFHKEGGVWNSFTPHKSLCGRLERVTALKFGDVRRMVDVGIVKVRGVEYAAHPKNLRIKGKTT